MLKAFKETIKCVYRPSLECGNEQSFQFFHSFVDKRKQNSKPFTERKVITCAHLHVSVSH